MEQWSNILILGLYSLDPLVPTGIEKATYNRF